MLGNGADAGRGHPELTQEQPLDAWLRQGANFRPQLEKRRVELQVELARVEALLAAIPDPDLPPPRPVTPAKPTYPELVRRVLERYPQGIGGRDVVADLRAIDKNVDPKRIYSALTRLVIHRGARVEGERGRQRYFPIVAVRLNGSTASGVLP